MGTAVPFELGRHVHPAAKPDPAAQAAPPPSGIDYLAMVEQRTAAQQRRQIAYAALPAPNLGEDRREAGGDPGAAGQDPAATPSLSPERATTIAPAGAGLHLPATLAPDPATPGAGPDQTLQPITSIEPADQPNADQPMALGEDAS
jgi:hypothetical protein